MSGQVGSETVTLGGLTVKNQGIAIVDHISVEAVDDPSSGIMGMAFESLASLGKPWWQNVYESGQVSEQAFAFWLKRNNDGGPSVDNNGGEFSIGELDSSKYTGNINYVPLSGQDYWRIPLDGVSLYGQNVDGVSGQAAIDTGTSLIGAKPALTAKFYANVPGAHPHSDYFLRLQGYYEYDCSTEVNVAFTFGGVSYNIKDTDFTIKHMTTDPNSCTGSIFSTDLGPDSPVDFIVGDSFLKNVYSVYDYGKRSVGFANVVQ